MSYKEKLEAATAKSRFIINDCINFEEYLSATSAKHFEIIKSQLSAKQQNAFKKGIVRFAFLIEPVNAEITSTKVEVRWTIRLDGDVRFATYENCLEIFENLLNKISSLSPEDFDIIRSFCENTVVAYELPIDYIDRYASPIHSKDNIDIFINDDIKKCIALRKIVKDPELNPDASAFATILSDKIQVKTYLTDRALTGDYKTNREKRWEAHPLSVQYALRRDCNKIETLLLLQICKFEGTNPTLVSNLQDLEILPTTFDFCTCPITGDIIQYTDFKDGVINPTHGRSKFQVGHLNPLKSSDTTGAFGHTANNISWISENGNRIQGSLSIVEVDELLLRIFRNRHFIDLI